MKRRLFGILMAVALLIAPVGVFAQAGPFTVGFQVQNLSSTQANISIQYVNGDGTTAATQNDTIPAGGSKTYFQTTMAAPVGFQGSVVISSDQPVAAIGNIVRSNFRAGGAYNGFSAGSTNLRLPIIQKNNSNINSFITIQNAGTTDATVNVAYTPSSVGTAATDTGVVKPGAAITFRQDTKTQLGTTFIGSATVTSNVPVVAVVNQESNGTITNSTTGGLSTYDSFAAGSATVLLPLLMANNSGFITGVGIQNAGTTVTNITLTFSPNTYTGTNPAACPTPPAKVFSNIAVNGGVTSIQAGFADAQFATCRYIGGGTVTSSNGQQLVAVVNQLALGGSFSSSYEGFNDTAATSVAQAPLVVSKNSGISSGIQVQNAGTSATTAVISFSANTFATAGGVTACNTPSNITLTNIAASASRTIILDKDLSGNDPVVIAAGFNGCRYIGGATVTTSTGGRIVSITNQLNVTGQGDQLLTYNLFNQ